MRNRRRKSSETLQNLHSDIRRLAALAFPKLDYRARETISCDYFLDALADPDLALKVRERNPSDLDSALRIALQLETWTRDVDRLRHEKRYDERRHEERNERRQDDRRTREVTKIETKADTRAETAIKTTEALRKEIEEQRQQIAELKDQVTKHTTTNEVSETKPFGANGQAKSFACWGCGEIEHSLWKCPKKTAEEKRHLYEEKKIGPKQLRPIKEKTSRTCIMVRYQTKQIRALLDTGSDITIAGNELAKKLRWTIGSHPTKFVKTANGEDMIIYGMTKLMLSVGDRQVESEILITPDLNGLILGIDWLTKQGEFVWDFRTQRIRRMD